MALGFFDVLRWKGRNYRRFYHAYRSFELELQQQPQDQSDSAQSANPTLAVLLEEARRLARYDVDVAWKFLNDARRLQICKLTSAKLENRRQELWTEVDSKLSGWRKVAVEELLTEAKITQDRLVEAQKLFDDFYDTQYYKNGLYRDQLRNLVIISAVAITWLLVLIGVSGTDPSQWGTWDWKRLLMVLLVGVLGACFSATTKMMSGDDQAANRIPRLATQGWSTLARTIFGATPALAAYAFLQANIVKVDNGSFAGMVVIAFISGFSEQFVLKLIKTVDLNNDPKPAPTIRAVDQKRKGDGNSTSES